MTDSLHAVKNTTHLRQMQAVYDYSRQQREIERARRQNILIRTISFVSISILLLVIVALLLSIKRKREKRKAWLIKYNEYVARLKSAKQDLEVLLLKKQSEIDDIIEKKRLEIEIIGQGKKGYERKIRNNSVNVGADLYLENELYSKLEASHRKRSAADDKQRNKLVGELL